MAAMNNFPAMTEAQRQLAALCKIEIKRWQAASESNPNMRYMAELMEIALAALTAKPRGYIDAGTPSDEINILTENKILKTDIALYTAPPAPVLRVPDGWIKCSERMPGVFDAVITSDGKSVNICLAEASAKYRYFTSILSGREVEVSHWMPLPPPPEASNEQ